MFTLEIPFPGKLSTKIQIRLLKIKIWYLDYFEYANLNDKVHFLCFRSKMTYLKKSDPNYQRNYKF